MTDVLSSSEILKTDRRGRVRFTSQRRQELLMEFEKSGLSAPEFTKVTGLSYSTFATWLQKHRRKRQALPSATNDQTVQWLETVIDKAHASATPGSTLLVRLPSGVAIEVADVSQASVAAALLRAWEKAAC